jgi:hypothetical protein
MKRTFLLLAALLSSSACGSKELTCAADQHVCSNACVSLQSDVRNCGACGVTCGAGQGCSAGACVDCATSPGVCTADVAVACGNLNQVRLLRSDLTLANPPLPTDERPISFAHSGSDLFVANSTTSSVSRIGLSPPSSTTGAQAIAIPTGGAFPDLEYLQAHAGLLWASNAGANTLVTIDPTLGAVRQEIVLPAGGPFGANPQGLDFVGSKGYLALFELNSVAVLDASNASAVTVAPATIDLSGLAAAGALARPSRVLAAGTRVYVSLNHLDAGFNAIANGRLAVIDATADQVVGSPIDLGSACLNPSGMALSGTTLWVACGFHLFNSADVTGAALVPVDVSGSAPIVGTPIPLGAHAAANVAVCGGKGYAGASESGTAIAFDPVARTVVGTALACPTDPGKASAILDIACVR